MTQLVPGDPAPDFALPDQNGTTVKLSDFQGQLVLLYFYPKADTPGCTAQSCAVRDALPNLEQLGVAALGISPDLPAKQGKFDRKYTLGFPLLSDPDHEVAELYGVWGEKSLYGKKYVGIVRSSFLIDKDGSIKHAWYKIKAGATVPNAMAALSE
jgi:peroxiredoxin Q/BCP